MEKLAFEDAFQPNDKGVFDIADIFTILENSEAFCQYKDVDIDDVDDQESEEAKRFLNNNGIYHDTFRTYVFGNLDYSGQLMAVGSQTNPTDINALLKAFYEN